MSVVVESDLSQRSLEGWLRSEEGLTKFVRQFLDGTLSIRHWTHRAHVGAAAWLIVERGRDEALQRLREAIPRYNVATGGANTESSGYHETLTVFWVDRISDLLVRLPESIQGVERIHVAVECLGMLRGLHRAYYSFDVVGSAEARKHWIAPDLVS